MTDDHRHSTATDLQYLGGLLETEWLPPLPLHDFSKIEVRHHVLPEEGHDCAAEYAGHVDTLRATADDQALKFTEHTTSFNANGDKHHTATIDMPQGKVKFSVLWIEREPKSDA